MARPRIVIVNDASQARGGATGLALLQARMLAQRGFEVCFVAGDRDPNADLAALGVTLFNAGTDPLMKAPPHVAATRGLWSRPVQALLDKVISETDTPDTVYHVHSWSKTLTPSAFRALARVAPRVFIHAHDFFLACPNGGFMDYQAMKPCSRTPLSVSCLTTQCDKRNLAQKGWRVSRQLLLRKSLPRTAPWGGILVIHPKMTDLLVQSGYPRDRIHTVRNPANALTARRIPAEKNARFLFIGRVEAEKGIEDVVAAARKAGVALTVVGDGPLREPLAAAHPDVRFTGWLDRQDIHAEAEGARALLMPSRYPEPFGLVAAEASLSGLPVVTSQTAMLGSEITAGRIGWSCDTLDTAAFAALLKQIADLPDTEMEALSKRAFSGDAGLCLTPDAWLDAQVSLYERAISAGQAPVKAAAAR